MNPIALLIGLLLPPVAAPISGHFALDGGMPKTHGYLAVSRVGGEALTRKIDLHLTTDEGTTIRRYDVDMTKLLHLIIVSDDFTTFMHVHPTLGPDGHFTLVQRFPKAGLYHVYGDAKPTGLSQQVFRYDVTVGTVGSPQSRDLRPSGTTAFVDGYRVSLDSASLHAGTENQLIVHITRDGKPANALHPYLGALAHGVFLNARTLKYEHVHPISLEDAHASMSRMSGMNAPPLPEGSRSSPDLQLHVNVREPRHV